MVLHIPADSTFCPSVRLSTTVLDVTL